MTTVFTAAPTASSAVTLALDGDEAAFRWIVETHISAMTQVCFVVCGDREIADEAVAASWPIAWQKLSSLRDPSSLRPWLVTIAANQARQLAGRRRLRTLREIPVQDTEVATMPLDRAAQMDLANALNRLGPDDRALLALRYVAGLNATELARATGLTPSGTRARLARLLDRMRTELRDD
jgi:RNA polymerase sigma-70 factor (ECF subfamily)